MLNITLLTGNFVLPDKATLEVVLDYRRSPIQTTTNGLQGLSVADLSDALVSTVPSGAPYPPDAVACLNRLLRSVPGDSFALAHLAKASRSGTE